MTTKQYTEATLSQQIGQLLLTQPYPKRLDSGHVTESISDPMGPMNQWQNWLEKMESGKNDDENSSSKTFHAKTLASVSWLVLITKCWKKQVHNRKSKMGKQRLSQCSPTQTGARHWLNWVFFSCAASSFLNTVHGTANTLPSWLLLDDYSSRCCNSGVALSN